MLIIILLGSVVLFATGLSDRLLATLFPQTSTPAPTPAEVGNPTIEPTPDLAATFDFLSTQIASGVDAALATRDALATYEATLNAPTPTHTPTPDLTAIALSACLFDVTVIEDEPIQPDILMPGQEIVKQWTIQNSGTCAWPEDTRLALVSGDEPAIVSRPEIGSLPPGERLTIRLVLRAPADFARYTSVWQLQYGAGNSIGELETDFRVDETPTPPRPTRTPTPEFTQTPTEPLWMSIPGVVECGTGATGRVEWGRGGGPSDEYRYFHGRIAPESELGGPYYDFVGFPHVETYFTTSGTFTFPVPEDCCPGDDGHYTSPEGYEIVWYKVWHPESNCPPEP
jgi:hypothetical protein